MATSPMSIAAMPRYRPGQLDANGNPLDAQAPEQSYLQMAGNPYGTTDNPDLNNPSPTNPIYGNVGAPPGGESGKFATTSAGTNLPTLNTDPNQPIHEGFYNDKAIEYGMGQQIYNEGQNQLGYYGPLQGRYQGAQDQALQDLKGTPGYTGQEQTDIRGDPNQARADVIAGVAGEEGAVGQYGNKLDTAVGGLKSGLSDAQSGFSKLDTAVGNPALAFDPNATEKQLTDADVQEMKTAAGTRVGNQYRSSEDTLMRQAAAAGNSSPMAVAAARARLEAQSAAGQGDAEVQADIAARQAQQDRASQIEAQREGAVQTQTGFKAGAATTEEAQAQNAAGLAGTQEIGAANAFGGADIAEQNTVTGQKANASNTFDALNSQRAGQIADARITGQGAYRSGVAQQQGMAQQGGQAAVGQQQAATNQVTTGLNTSTANRANYENTGPGGLGKAGTTALNTIASVFKEGGIVNEPTIGIVAEHGPEWVQEMPRYRPRKAA